LTADMFGPCTLTPNVPFVTMDKRMFE
jgi:hypothetical protein